MYTHIGRPYAYGTSHTRMGQHTHMGQNSTTMCQPLSYKPGCSSLVFSVMGLKYNKIRGMVRGYQQGTTDGFSHAGTNTQASMVHMLMGYPLHWPVFLVNTSGPMHQSSAVMVAFLAITALVLLYLDQAPLPLLVKTITVILIIIMSILSMMFPTLNLRYGMEPAVRI